MLLFNSFLIFYGAVKGLVIFISGLNNPFVKSTDRI
jgi:hypothetical protein